jgi:hypothetical protein
MNFSFGFGGLRATVRHSEIVIRMFTATRMIKNSYDISINAYFEWGVVGDKKFKNKKGY